MSVTHRQKPDRADVPDDILDGLVDRYVAQVECDHCEYPVYVTRTSHLTVCPVCDGVIDLRENNVGLVDEL
jgi:hypothetical protein